MLCANRFRALNWIVGISAFALFCSVCPVQAAAPVDQAQLYQQTVDRGIRYLRSQGQARDGSYSQNSGIGITALATTAALKHGRSATDPLVDRGVKYLLQNVQPDGGIYQPGTIYRNYETCLSILCLNEANRDGQYDKVLKRADAFIKSLQWGGAEDSDRADTAFGGGGYGKHKRPDLSNTSFLVEALLVGNDPDSEAIRNALVFISRCQNHESPHNTTTFATKNPDGGFYYTIAAGGSSQAGPTPQGGLRSYASMTYAGLKSMIYAGVGPEDSRVKAALTWIRRNYDLKSNPGLRDAGLFYYYHTFAKALDAVGSDTVTDAKGESHNWRAELLSEIASRQQPNGSWVNEKNPRWLEGDSNLVTAYALLALSHCRPSQVDVAK